MRNAASSRAEAPAAAGDARPVPDPATGCGDRARGFDDPWTKKVRRHEDWPERPVSLRFRQEVQEVLSTEDPGNAPARRGWCTHARR